MVANRLRAKRKRSQNRAKIVLTILSALVHVSLRLINVDADVPPAHAAVQALVLPLTAAVAVMVRQTKKIALQLISPKTNVSE